jgi:hypothetical protein
MSYISSRYLFVGSGLSLIPWGLLAFGFGFFTRIKLLASQRGFIYGFAQSFIFLWLDKSGMTSVGQFLFLVVVVSGLSVAAAACGWWGARLGWLIRSHFSVKRSA